jgi:hypothetical protein
MQGTAQADSGFYLQQMQQSSDDSKTNWQLLAIRALLKEGKSQQAIELFNQLPQKLTTLSVVSSLCWPSRSSSRRKISLALRPCWINSLLPISIKTSRPDTGRRKSTSTRVAHR